LEECIRDLADRLGIAADELVERFDCSRVEGGCSFVRVFGGQLCSFRW